TRSAVSNAEKKIREILGEEKSARFLDVLRKRISGGGVGIEVARPNAVPTDTRVVVNAPAYRMDIFENGQLKKTYRVGIGYPEFPLPTGLRKAETIIFNPTWTPPDEPWVKGKFAPGKTVAAGSKDNPLGRIKIPIGLPSLIHGGKDPSRLGTFASHGCVGLTNTQIRDFASEISALSGSQISPETINGYLKEKDRTKDVKLGQPVLVELRYETIVVENGQLKIYRDVYEYGTNTEDNLRRVLDGVGVSFESLQPADREKILAGLESMGTGATGKPVDIENRQEKANTNKNTNKNEQSDRVTRNIKGKKEATFQLAELLGKGYPAPVNLVSR
ncbi:MAG: L,D-transpeptidase, partial [Acidobacteria bacterium]|nr:L,D-transpeptidase [Acidobacteriota bacterium]